MKRTILSLLLTLVTAGPAWAAPNEALQIQDTNVVKYGVRLRVTKGAWDYVKLTLRDTFKVWSAKGGSGANLILDPGYNGPQAGGLARTTPFIMNVGDYQGVDRPPSEKDCGSCNGTDLDYRFCGYRCVQRGRENIMAWCQVRKPGYNPTDRPQVPWSIMGPTRTEGVNYFREFGFYLAPVASSSGGGLCPTVTTYYDFTELQFCSNYYSYDTGSGAAGTCSDAPESIIGINIHYNARIFIFPNMRQEYAADPVDGWAPPVIRGPYAGYSGTANVAGWETSCAGANPGCTDIGSCSCSGWGCTPPRRYTVNGCNAGVANMPVYTWFAALPQTPAAHSPYNAFSIDSGTYFRGGDDAAIYLNIYQMQVQSVDRASAFERDCEPETVYTGRTSGGEPVYFTDETRMANCMRPKMYYDTTKLRWKQCDPFDTWNTDGTYNLANDDAKWMYPGHPVTAGFGSPGVCGGQPCTGIYCANPPATRRTTDLNDLFRAGGGWYMMRIDYVTLNPAANKMDLQLTAPDLRAEIGAAVDVHTNIFLFGDVNVNNKRLLGRIRADSLVVKASLRLFSIDDTSCNLTYQNSCGGNWQRLNDGRNVPDKFVADIVVDSLTINPPAGDWFIGDCSDVVFDILVYKLTMCTLVNGLIKGMLIGILENALKNMIGPALGGFVASIPRLNDVLGNPFAMGTVLLETGLYMAGADTAWEYVPPSDGYTKRWPIPIRPGPTAAQNMVDIRFAVGFKPIAFRPPSTLNWNKQLMEIDTNDPPLADSVYGIPTLMNQDTSICAKADYCDYAPNPDREVHTGCSRRSGKNVDPDGMYDTDDFCQGTTGYASSGSYINQKTGAAVAVADAAVIPEFWQGPIADYRKPPSWCLSAGAIGMPRTLRTGGTPASLDALYPSTSWLSFDSTYDTNPAGVAVAKNTIGNFDAMPGGTVLQQNVNTGALDPAAVPYDLSIHIHQKVFAELLQSVFATGIGCIEFSGSATDAVGQLVSGILSPEALSAFLPEVKSLFPGWSPLVRISPMKAPRVRTGAGTLTYMPRERTKDPTGGPLPISSQRYTLGMLFPDIRIEFLVENPDTQATATLLTAYWSPVVGFYAKAVRACYKLDPLKTDPSCTSTFTNVRTVSGYYELYLDVGSDSVAQAFENTRDGFAAGTLTTDSIGTTRGSAPFVIESTYCSQTGYGKCKVLTLAQSIATLMNSFVQVFLVTRLSFYNLTLDFLYIGPDGLNEDGIGGGDYLGIYTRFLGNLNVFGLINAMGGLGLASTGGNMQPMAVLQNPTETGLFNTNQPKFPISLQPALQQNGSDLSYTYRVDQGFWRTPVNDAVLEVPPVLDGEHTLEVRAIEDSDWGAMAAKVPTVMKFRVDTVAPELEILPSKRGFFGEYAPIKAADVQTPSDELQLAYKLDDDDWSEFSGDSVSLRWQSAGRHVLRVKATDLAGNSTTATREIILARGRFGCAAGGGDLSLPAVMLLLAGIWVARRRRA